MTNDKSWVERGFPGGTSGKEPTCQCRRHKKTRVQSPGQEDPLPEHGNPLQYSCLENPVDRGAWRAAVHGVTESQTRLKQLSMHKKVRSLRKGKRAELCNAQTPPGKLSGLFTWACLPSGRVGQGPRNESGGTEGSPPTWETTRPDHVHGLWLSPHRQMPTCSPHPPGTTWPGSFCLIVPPALFTLSNTSSPQDVLWENDAARLSSTTKGTAKKKTKRIVVNIRKLCVIWALQQSW